MACSVTVYPNPNTGTFTFIWQPKNTRLTKSRLTIKDISGRLIYSQNISAFNRQQIELKDAPAGVYFYQLQIEGLAPEIGKLIIQ